MTRYYTVIPGQKLQNFVEFFKLPTEGSQRLSIFISSAIEISYLASTTSHYTNFGTLHFVGSQLEPG